MNYNKIIRTASDNQEFSKHCLYFGKLQRTDSQAFAFVNFDNQNISNIMNTARGIIL